MTTVMMISLMTLLTLLLSSELVATFPNVNVVNFLSSRHPNNYARYTIPTTTRWSTSTVRKSAFLSTSAKNAVSNNNSDDHHNPSSYPHVIISNSELNDASSSSEWVQKAALRLQKYGICALLGQDDDSSISSSLLMEPLCDSANDAAISRLTDLSERIRNRGVDPFGVEDGPFRFMEVVCRDEGGRRYEMPVPWMGGSSSMGTPLNTEQSNAIRCFHESLDQIVQPVIMALWNSEKVYACNVAAAGFLINQPGSKSQSLHRDGPDSGFIDVFVPLIDLTEELGPTSLLPGTHHYLDGDDHDDQSMIAPLLKKGQILMFDYRILHKGLGNKSSSHTSRTLAYAVYARESSSDVHNFPDALTLEYD